MSDIPERPHAHLMWTFSPKKFPKFPKLGSFFLGRRPSFGKGDEICVILPSLGRGPAKILSDTADKWVFVDDTDIIKGVSDNIRLVKEKSDTSVRRRRLKYMECKKLSVQLSRGATKNYDLLQAFIREHISCKHAHVGRQTELE
jgi:hypothetical protein